MANDTVDELCKKIDAFIEYLKNLDENGPEHKSLLAKEMAYYYTLIRFNGLDEKSALSFVKENSYEQLKMITQVDFDDKLKDAARCVRKHLFKVIECGVDDSFEEAVEGFYRDGRPIERDLEDNFMKAVGRELISIFEKNGNIDDVILDIAEEIHNKWVLENAKDFKTNHVDENLYKHLPFELTGLDEISESLFYVLPIMDRFDVYIGNGPNNIHREFKLSSSLQDRYIDRVDRFLDQCKINSEEDLKKLLPTLIKGCELLNPKNAPKGQKELFEKRLEYVLKPEKLEIIQEQIEEKNGRYGHRFLCNEWGINI